MARLIRELASSVGVIVPGACYSAGTLFALSADEIYLTRSGNLSPIDPTITTALNPVAAGNLPQANIQIGQLVPVSVESVAAYKEMTIADWSKDRSNGDEIVLSALRLLNERVHPLALGDVYRRRQQIERLAATLLQYHHKNADRIQKIVKRLAQELGSHDYPIYRTEALEILEDQIAPYDSELEEMYLALFDDFSEELLLGVPYNAAVTYNAQVKAGHTPPISLRQKASVLESIDATDVYEQVLSLNMIDLQPTGQKNVVKAVQQEVVEQGWKHYI